MAKYALIALPDIPAGRKTGWSERLEVDDWGKFFAEPPEGKGSWNPSTSFTYSIEHNGFLCSSTEARVPVKLKGGRGQFCLTAYQRRRGNQEVSGGVT